GFHLRVHAKWIETEGNETPAGNARLRENPHAEKPRRLKDRPLKGSNYSGMNHRGPNPLKLWAIGVSSSCSR
ncbi:hypothetical protein, partial [Peribacillus muralis]|uniref:hypothetical protein n=1 Tax=Peribacillus muralis TaxID=264697 RepID=UPI001F1AD91B